MKKRLLITSIVMMLVVAVALSTATYAWFTSNVSVTANSITMTAGTSTSSALGIEWTAGTSGTGFNAHYTTSIDSVAPASTISATPGFQPAAPVLLNTISDHSAPVFKTAFINAQDAFLAAGAETPVYRFANALSTAQDFSELIHVANLAQSGDQTLYLTATITGVFEAVGANETASAAYTYYDSNKALLSPQPAANSEVTSGYKIANATNGAALIRVAVYEVTTTTTANDTFTYKGLLGATAGSNNTAQGAIAATNASNDLLTASTTTELNLGTIAAQADKAYAVYVWLDGELFDEAKSGNQAQVALNFSTQKVSADTVAEINGPQQQQNG